MLLPPLSVIASWPPANYVNPESHGSEGTIISSVLYPFVFFAVALRIYTRCRVSHSFGLDDILILFALVPTTGFMILSLWAQYKLGISHHVWDLKLDKVILGIKVEIVSEVFFALATTSTRLSMLALVTRLISSTSSDQTRKYFNAAMILIAIQGIIFCLVVVFQCRPPQDTWKLSFTPQPNCINRVANLLAAGIINTISDFIVVGLPIPTVNRLQLRSRQRIIVTALFGGGFLICCAGITRTVFTYRFSVSFDPTWDGYPVWITSSIELYLGIICTSLPPTRPFFARYIPAILGNSSSSLPSHSKLSEAYATPRAKVFSGEYRNRSKELYHQPTLDTKQPQFQDLKSPQSPKDSREKDDYDDSSNELGSPVSITQYPLVLASPVSETSTKGGFLINKKLPSLPFSSSNKREPSIQLRRVEAVVDDSYDGKVATRPRSDGFFNGRNLTRKASDTELLRPKGFLES